MPEARKTQSLPDDLTDALIDKLGAVSEAWTDTFPPTPKGYARLQTAINRYGYPTVRSALQYALEERITPNGPNAMPLLVGLCKAREPKAEVEGGSDQRYSGGDW